MRKEKGLTQRELGERLNMTQSAIGQFENGKTGPSLKTIIKFAATLDVDTGILLESLKKDIQIDYKKREYVGFIVESLKNGSFYITKDVTKGIFYETIPEIKDV
ncbi:helix-turn-helix transcriptional regulator [Lachnospiraceae bacterium ZAX-1]